MSKVYPVVRKIFIVSSILILVSCGGSGGGSSDDDPAFPTPTLPAGALKIDNANANATAVSAASFGSVLSVFTQLKTGEPVTVSQFIKRVTNQVVKRNSNSGLTAFRVEDLSSIFCLSGTAIADIEESSNSASGSVNFSDCDIGGGIIVNDGFIFDASSNGVTLDYNFHIGGTLRFDFGVDTVTIVLNLTESGNDGTGDFSFSISFSLSGIPGGGYLVTTSQPLTGNVFTGLSSGQLIVQGSDNTRLRITVTGINMADVDLDDGSGTFVFHSTITFVL